MLTDAYDNVNYNDADGYTGVKIIALGEIAIRFDDSDSWVAKSLMLY